MDPLPSAHHHLQTIISFYKLPKNLLRKKANITAKELDSISSMMLNVLMEKLKNIHLRLIPKSRRHEFVVANDIKEGYFSVVSVNAEEEPKRFIVELHWLTNPSFLKLLKQAEDEYGFQQKGVLEVPCLAADLQKILKLNIGRNTIANFTV